MQSLARAGCWADVGEPEQTLDAWMAAVKDDLLEGERRIEGSTLARSTASGLRLAGLALAVAAALLVPVLSARHFGPERLLAVGPLVATLGVLGLLRLERWATTDRRRAEDRALARTLVQRVLASRGVVRRADLPPVRALRFVDQASLAEQVGLRSEGPFIVDPARSQAPVAEAEARWREAAARGVLHLARVRRWERDPVDALALRRLLQRRALSRTPEGVRPARRCSPYRDGPDLEERPRTPSSVIRVKV